jgi:type II secretory pathway component PulF
LTDDQPILLSREEARLMAEQLAVLANAGLPLAAGLRAGSEEMPSRRLSAAMSAVAERLEHGRSLDDVLRGSPRMMPEHMLSLVETGVRAGNLPAVLSQLVEIDRASFDLRRSIRLAIAYPLLLLTLCMLLISFTAMYVLPDLKVVMKELLENPPWATAALFWFSGPHVLAAFGVGLAAVTMAIVLSRISMPPQQWRWLQTRIPLVGPAILWRGIANWARLVSLLLKQGLPAPEALRLAATGVNDSLMAVEGLRLARSISHGRSIADGLGIIGSLPTAIAPIIRWGEEQNSLPEAFDTVAEMYENRMQQRARLLQATLSPFAFIVVATLAIWFMNALFMPLIKLYQSFFWFRPRRPTAIPDWVEFLNENSKYIVAGIFIGLGVFIFLWPAIMINVKPAAYAGRDRIERYSAGLSKVFMDTVKFTFWFGVFGGLLVGLVILCGVLGLVIWGALIAAIETMKDRNAELERRALMWLIATAVEKGIPLAKAAHAFAADRHDKLGRRVRVLAEQLSRGVSLDEALWVARIRLPTDMLLAVRTAHVTNSVGTLVNSSRNTTGLDITLQKAAGKCFYLIVLAIVAAIAIGYLQMKINPAFAKIFADFQQKAPTRLFWLSPNLPFAVTPLGIASIMFLVGLVGLLFYFVARYTGQLRWDPPLAREIVLPLDEALVLRSLGEAVEHNQPIYAMVAALARKYPKGYIRSRLQSASNQMSNGVDWCDSLHASQLLPAADAAVLKSAERVGNLSWAMNDTAERLVRRFVRRAGGVMAVAFPLVLLVFAGIVLSVTCGLLDPLAELITRLSYQ